MRNYFENAIFFRRFAAIFFLFTASAFASAQVDLERNFTNTVRPFLESFILTRAAKLAGWAANLVYALGRSLMLSDEPTIDDIRTKLAANGYRISTLVESIATSPQFLTKRGSQ